MLKVKYLQSTFSLQSYFETQKRKKEEKGLLPSHFTAAIGKRHLTHDNDLLNENYYEYHYDDYYVYDHDDYYVYDHDDFYEYHHDDYYGNYHLFQALQDEAGGSRPKLSYIFI